MVPATMQDGEWHAKAIAASWDQVVSDYKIFHDVRARGGTAQDVPVFSGKETLQTRETPAARPDDAKPETSTHDDGGGHSDTDVGPGGRSAEALPLEEKVQEQDHNSHGQQSSSTNSKGSVSQNPAETISAIAPQMVMGGLGGDESLKKLLMSWYYAGYYTGLYEGQQQAKQQSHQTHPTEQPQPSQTDN